MRTFDTDRMRAACAKAAREAAAGFLAGAGGMLLLTWLAGDVGTARAWLAGGAFAWLAVAGIVCAFRLARLLIVRLAELLIPR